MGLTGGLTTTSASVTARGWTWIVRGNVCVSEIEKEKLLANFSHWILAFPKQKPHTRVPLFVSCIKRTCRHLPIFQFQGEIQTYGVLLIVGVILTGDEIQGVAAVLGIMIQFVGGTAGLTIMHALLTVMMSV